jgi:V8-like Glu-specific endopeptidase
MTFKIFSLFSFLFVSNSFFSQISNFGLPISYKDKFSKTKEFYQTPIVNAADQILLDEQEQKLNGLKMYRFGKEFPVSIDLISESKKTILHNGDCVYQFGIECKDAISINVIFDQFKLGKGVRVYLADVNEKSYDGAYTSLNNNSSNILGTDLIYTQKAIIEIFVPKESIGKSILHLGTIVHGYRDLNQLAKSLNSSGSCEIDVNCPLGAGWENQRNSVAMMVNGGGFCTGSLVNNTSGTVIPYFLTANHCGTSVASVVFRFRWESPAGQVDCATSAPSVNGPDTMNINGAILRANSANSDFLLAELNSTPNPNWGIYYNGWDRSGIAATQLTGIHHPAGDIKKISRDNSTAVESTWTGTPLNNHWRVPSWDEGVTEGGSSGSPLFDENHRTIGQLHGGGSSCGLAPAQLWDDYGKFSISWEGEGSNSNRLRNWLDPSNLGSLFIDGLDPLVPNALLDAGVNSPENVNGNICGTTTLTPKITISNSGSTTLTSVDINYGFDGVTNLTYNWTGSLSTYQTETVTLPNSTLTAGNHSFSAYVTNPNGGIDENINNDLISDSLNIIIDGEIDTLNLTLDEYGSEITWNLKDVNSEIIYSGGPYSDAGACVTTLVKIPMCLNYGCYDFTIIDDVFGDGLSTTGCEGSYTITRPDNTVAIELLVEDANFGASNTKNYCIADNLSLDELYQKEQILIYPNPASTEITIDTKYLNPTKIEVMSIIGQNVSSNTDVSNLTKIDVSNFSKGMYLVKITSKTGVILKEVFVR